MPVRLLSLKLPALTDPMCPLEYWSQSGALNENLSDVLGALVR